MGAFKIKTNFYYKYKQLVKLFLKIACNTGISMDTFKIKHNFCHKSINN